MSNKYTLEILASDKTKAAFNSVQKNLKNTDKSFSNFNKSSSQGVQGLGRSAGMASIQFQQFFGQVQGGTNTLVALSQQSADLGFVLGAPLAGAVAGITASLATFLLPSLGKSKTAIQELEEVSKSISNTLSISSGGVVDFSESLEKLAERSEALAKVQISTGIADASEQIKIAADGIRENITDLSQGTFQSFNKALEGSGESQKKFADGTDRITHSAGFSFELIQQLNTAVIRLGEKFDITEGQAVGLASAFSTFQNNRNAEGLAALESELGKINEQTGFTNDEIREFTNNLFPFFDAIREGTEFTEALETAFNDLNTVLEEDTADPAKYQKIADLTRQMAQQVAISELLLKGNTDEAERLKTAFANGFDTFKEMPQVVQDLYITNKQNTDEIKAQSEAAKERHEIEAEAAAQAAAEIARIKSEEDKRIATMQSITDSLKIQTITLQEGEQAAFEYNTALRLGLESAELIPEALQAQIDKLFELKAAQDEIGGDGSFWEQMREHIKSTSEDFDAMWGNSFDRFASGIGDATAQALVEGEDLSETMKTFARSAIQEVISGLIQIGIKRVALGAIESALTAKSTAETITATTAIATSTAESMAPAAAATSLATAGTNSGPAITGMGLALGAALGIFAAQSFDGGGYTGSGARVGGLDGKGGRLAMIHPQEHITDFTKGQSLGNQISMSMPITIQGDASRDTIKKLQREQKRFGRMVNSTIGVPR